MMVGVNYARLLRSESSSVVRSDLRSLFKQVKQNANKMQQSFLLPSFFLVMMDRKKEDP